MLSDERERRGWGGPLRTDEWYHAAPPGIVPEMSQGAYWEVA
jgi:hypothetical protein